jgi:predicted GNAT family N-acyltransferase
LLAEAKSRKGQGKGHNLIIKSTRSTGQQPVNIVLSLEDVKKLKQLNKQFKFDKQGKYIILIGREIAGGKGQYPDGVFVMHTE